MVSHALADVGPILTFAFKIYPMACIRGAVPWWGLLYNWLIGVHTPQFLFRGTNPASSHLRKPVRKLVLCVCSDQMYVQSQSRA